MISWLLGPTVASLAAALLVVRVFSSLVDGADAAKGALFSGTWGVVTAGMGMNKFTKGVRGKGTKSKLAKNAVDALKSDERH